MNADVNPEIAPTQCTATANHGGRCRAKAMAGKGICRAHAMTPEERAQFVKAGNEARSEQRRARESGVEAARMGLKAMLGARLEARADALTARLEGLALSEDDAIALRGIELWLSRVYGKAVQPTSDVTPELPADVEALRAMSPEERRALLQSMPPLRP